MIKSGFTKWQALGSQFFTAVGAFVGTFLGIWIAETTGTGKAAALKVGEGLFGTTVSGGDLVIPATAGGEVVSSYKNAMLTVRLLVYRKRERCAGIIGREPEWDTGAERGKLLGGDEGQGLNHSTRRWDSGSSAWRVSHSSMLTSLMKQAVIAWNE